MTFLAEVMRRQPWWLARLERPDFAPVSLVSVRELHEGDIIDIRDFRVEMEESNAYLHIDDIRSDDRGVHSITGVLPDETAFTIAREDGVPMNRRRVPRYVRRRSI